MALIFPSIENIERLKVTPQPGEWFLLKHLIDTLDDSFEIYFQPFLNGDRPDIILMKEKSGVVIIEVKDWLLKNYSVSKKQGNRPIDWYLKKNGSKIKSPLRQLTKYKDNMFNLHIDGLHDELRENMKVYGVVKLAVCFSKAKREEIDKFINEGYDYKKDFVYL